MKKLVLMLLFIASLCCAFALDGKILEVVGKAEKQSGNGNWIPIKKGDLLSPGDIISTGFKSEVVIEIGKSTVIAKALTRMTMEQLYEKNDNHVSSVYVDVGSISADVKAVENKRVGFTVKTPAVTASVRGTEGNVYAYGKVESIRGTWALMPPQPKVISYDRGDAAQTQVAEEPSVGMQTPETEVPQVAEAEQASEVESEASTETETETTAEPEVASETASQDVAIESETQPVESEPVAPSAPAEVNTPAVDLELDAILASTKSEKEIRVPAGEIAQVSIANPGVIQTPMQVKESNSKSIATAQTKLSAKEGVSTAAPVDVPRYGKIDIFFEFVE